MTTCAMRLHCYAVCTNFDIGPRKKSHRAQEDRRVRKDNEADDIVSEVSGKDECLRHTV